MRLAELISIDRVTTEFEAADKAAALRAIARMFTASDPALAEDDVLAVLLAREQLASTGVGSGVAIPHGRLGALTSLRAALAISRGGVEFDSLDNAPARIFVALLGPDRHTGDHLKALARISRVLRDDAVRAKLIAAPDAATALAVLISEDDLR